MKNNHNHLIVTSICAIVGLFGLLSDENINIIEINIDLWKDYHVYIAPVAFLIYFVYDVFFYKKKKGNPAILLISGVLAAYPVLCALGWMEVILGYLNTYCGFLPLVATVVYVGYEKFFRKR